MENGRDILFINGAHEQMSQEFDSETPLLTACYGLARTWPAVFDESTLTSLQQQELKMSRITAQALAAQEAVGDLYLFSLYRAQTTIAAVEQIADTRKSSSGMSALEEFHRAQRTQFLAHLSQIASRSAALILTEMR